MGFNSFRANVWLRTLVVMLLCFVLFWSLANTAWLAMPVLCALLLLLSMYNLIWYVERTGREFTSFLNSIAHHDYSTRQSAPASGRDFDALQAAYSTLAGELRRLDLQKAANHQYLEAVIEHVDVALCCFDDAGMVKMFNEPAKKLFGVPHLASLRSFERVDARLPDLLPKMADGERTLLSVRRADETLELVLYATRFDLLDQRYKLVSFQNIRHELDRQEMDSWQKLIRVLTHEIMNSVTPIISLSGLIRETLVGESGVSPAFRKLSDPEQNDVLRGVAAIHARSSGLLEFVQAYRNFSRLPTPEFAQVDVRTLLEGARMLMSTELEARGIAVELTCEQPGMTVRADPRQAEQILINLLRNAVEALANRPGPRIELNATRDEQGRTLIQVIDNGAGISLEHMDSIFVPFFTTKLNGSGVGLSISRQLMHINRGFISVSSRPGQGTVFTLKFPPVARA